jgi:hypothetical protein
MQDAGYYKADAMGSSDALDELIQLSAQDLVFLDKGFSPLGGQRACISQESQVLDRFIAGGVGVYQKAQELGLIAAASEALHDISGDRFGRTADLAGFFGMLPAGQFRKTHAVNLDSQPMSHLIDFQILVSFHNNSHQEPSISHASS